MQNTILLKILQIFISAASLQNFCLTIILTEACYESTELFIQTVCCEILLFLVDSKNVPYM